MKADVASTRRERMKRDGRLLLAVRGEQNCPNVSRDNGKWVAANFPSADASEMQSLFLPLGNDQPSLSENILII